MGRVSLGLFHPAMALPDMAVPVSVAAFRLGLGVAAVVLACVVWIEAVVLARMRGEGLSRTALLHAGVINAASTGLGVWAVVRVGSGDGYWRGDPYYLGVPSRIDPFLGALRDFGNTLPGLARFDLRWLYAVVVLCLCTMIVEFVVLRLLWRGASWAAVFNGTAAANLASYAFLAVIVPLLRA